MPTDGQEHARVQTVAVSGLDRGCYVRYLRGRVRRVRSDRDN